MPGSGFASHHARDFQHLPACAVVERPRENQQGDFPKLGDNFGVPILLIHKNVQPDSGRYRSNNGGHSENWHVRFGDMVIHKKSLHLEQSSAWIYTVELKIIKMDFMMKFERKKLNIRVAAGGRMS